MSYATDELARNVSDLIFSLAQGTKAVRIDTTVSGGKVLYIVDRPVDKQN